jgi:hypothetical protein
LSTAYPCLQAVGDLVGLMATLKKSMEMLEPNGKFKYIQIILNTSTKSTNACRLNIFKSEVGMAQQTATSLNTAHGSTRDGVSPSIWSHDVPRLLQVFAPNGCAQAVLGAVGPQNRLFVILTQHMKHGETCLKHSESEMWRVRHVSAERLKAS